MRKTRTEQSPAVPIRGVQPWHDMNEDPEGDFFDTEKFRVSMDHFVAVVNFVGDRLHEDERIASSAYISEQDDRISTRVTIPYKRLQAEVDAKREIMLQALSQIGALSMDPHNPVWRGAAWIAADNLVTVARIYKDHPDFPK